MYYTYLLKSKRYNQLYIGSTNDLQKRFKEHNDGKEISTRRYKPWKLLYYEAYPIEALARRREKRLKYHGNALRELKKRLGGIFKKSGAGFTLIELLIVIAIIVILIAVALFAINPFRQIGAANDNKRTHDLNQVLSAIQQNIIDNRGNFFCTAGSIPTCDPDGSGVIMGSGSDQYDICGCLVSTYLSVMPVDPQVGYYKNCDDYDTQYEICEGSIILRAPHTQKIEKAKVILPGQVEIKSPSWEFDLSVNPLSDSAVQGSSVSASVSTNLISGTTQFVTFSASGLPQDANVSFLPNSCKSPCSSTMNISTSINTPAGAYSILIKGTSGGVIKTTNYSLAVAETTRFNWLQTDWSAGADPNPPYPTHSNNQIGWNKYYSKDAEIDDSVQGRITLTP